MRRLQSAGDWIKNAWKAIGDFLKTVWQAAWQAMVAFMSGQINQAVQNVRNMVNLIKLAFNINWSELGKRIIDGIVAGLKNGVSAVANMARQVAKSAVEAAKNALGIKSPSTVFMQLGVSTGEGFVRGFQTSMSGPRIGQTLHKMTQQATNFQRTIQNNVRIYNPTPEPASVSVAGTLKRLSYLGVLK